jgi:hypothetical protein
MASSPLAPLLALGLVWPALGAEAFGSLTTGATSSVKPSAKIAAAQLAPCRRLALFGGTVFIDQVTVATALANRPANATGPLVELDQPGTLYCLVSDVTEPRTTAQPGMNALFGILAEGVTLDLNGHAIQGALPVAPAGASPTAAVSIGAVSRAVVRGGRIAGFDYGVHGDALASGQADVLVERLTITNPNGIGILLAGFTQVVVRSNVIEDVFLGVFVLFRQLYWVHERVEIADNQIRLRDEGAFVPPEYPGAAAQPISTGISAELARETSVLRNRVTLDPGAWGVGIELSSLRWYGGSEVDRADVEDNEIHALGQGTGIWVDDAPGLRMVENLVEGERILASQEGIVIDNSLDVSVEANTLCTLRTGVEFYAKTAGRTTAASITGNEFWDVVIPWSDRSGSNLQFGWFTVGEGGCGGAAE